MPNNERNARLAKWMCGDGPWRWKAIDDDGCGYERVPPFDTNPAAALELLGWLMEKGWTPFIHPGLNQTTVGFHPPANIRRVKMAIGIGPPLTALPEAIAQAAEAVRKLEEGEDNG